MDRKLIHKRSSSHPFYPADVDKLWRIAWLSPRYPPLFIWFPRTWSFKVPISSLLPSRKIGTEQMPLKMKRMTNPSLECQLITTHRLHQYLFLWWKIPDISAATCRFLLPYTYRVQKEYTEQTNNRESLLAIHQFIVMLRFGKAPREISAVIDWDFYFLTLTERTQNWPLTTWLSYM